MKEIILLFSSKMSINAQLFHMFIMQYYRNPTKSTTSNIAAFFSLSDLWKKQIKQ